MAGVRTQRRATFQIVAEVMCRNPGQLADAHWRGVAAADNDSMQAVSTPVKLIDTAPSRPA